MVVSSRSAVCWPAAYARLARDDDMFDVPGDLPAAGTTAATAFCAHWRRQLRAAGLDA